MQSVHLLICRKKASNAYMVSYDDPKFPYIKCKEKSYNDKKAFYFLMVHQTHNNINYLCLFKTRIVCILGESNFLNGPMSSRKPGDSIVNNICGGTQSEEESILWLIIYFMQKWYMTRNNWLQGGSI